MSLISAIRDYIATYTGLKAGAPVWVNYLATKPTVQFDIVSIGGNKITATNIDDSTEREYPFAMQMSGSTADQVTRLQNLGFFEDFSDWLDTQSIAGILPTLGAKQSPFKMIALGQAFQLEQGSSNTGIYQLQCKLVYKQQP